jgi:uncharacterized protein (DUF1330 family)
MPAYVVVDVTVRDPDRYPEYTRQVPDSLRPFGGRFIVRGGATETVEGDWRPGRLVIIEFPSMEQARAWYESPGYASARSLRHELADANLLFVEGVPVQP